MTQASVLGTKAIEWFLSSSRLGDLQIWHISDLRSNSVSKFNLGHQELMFYDIMCVKVFYGAWAKFDNSQKLVLFCS